MTNIKQIPMDNTMHIKEKLINAIKKLIRTLYKNTNPAKKMVMKLSTYKNIIFNFISLSS